MKILDPFFLQLSSLRIFTTQWSMREHEDNWAAKDMLLRLLGDDSNFYADLICTAQHTYLRSNKPEIIVCHDDMVRVLIFLP